jgi:WASH complex subunit strumpellin
VTISGVADLSYGWEILHSFVDLMQKRIKAEPSSVLLLRSTFLKLSSILDLPLVRILQAGSPDLVSVSEYYSTELVGFVRRVLEVVPRSMFQALAEVIQLHTSKIQPLPTRLEKDKLKTYAQLDQRFALAKATYNISVFTEGILAMQRTLVGVIQVDPRQLLEDGIRKELVKTIAWQMNATLLKPSTRIEDFHARLLELTQKLDGLRRSFQYI